MVYRIVPRTEDELYHYGVLGMKWGVRRYQDYDGTRIGTGGKPVIDQAKRAGNSVALGQGGKATGNARLAATAKPQSSDSNDGEGSSKPKSKADIIFGPESKKGKGKDPSSHAKDMLNEVGNLAEGAGKVAENAKKRDKKVQEANAKQQKTQQKKAKEMSDQELRESINRIKMEREYVSLTTKEVETGYDKFQDVMKDVKDIAVTAGAIAGLILSIIKIKQALHSGIVTADQYDELKGYIDSGMFSDDVIAHAACLDSDYILDYYDLTEDDIQHWLDDEDELYHHGVLGMKWGVRRYQNYDGTRIGGGGSNKASNSFRNTIVGGQGGKATGNARLAAKAPGIGSKKVGAYDDLMKTAKTIPKKYGDSVSIKKKNDTESYVISDGKYIVSSNAELQQMGSDLTSLILMEHGFTTNKEVDQYFKKHPDELENCKQNVDAYMELIYSEKVRQEGRDTKATREKKAAEERAQREQSEAIDSVYKALEKEHPNFNKLPQDVQDEMWFDYVNEHPEIDKKIFGD